MDRIKVLLEKFLLLQAVHQLKKDSLYEQQTLADFKNMVCNECQPSYFNLAKAMYPFLADAYELNQILFKTEIERGAFIGRPSMTMEAIIAQIKNTSDHDSVHFQLADRFEKRMALANDYAFLTAF